MIGKLVGCTLMKGGSRPGSSCADLSRCAMLPKHISGCYMEDFSPLQCPIASYHFTVV